MATKYRMMAAFSLLTIAAFLLAACGGGTVVQTQIVERVVTQEVQVEVQAEPYTTPHPVLGDIRVRKAIAYCTNRPELIASVYPWVDDPNSLLMDTFIPSDHWAHADGVEQYPFDADQGMALLEEAGWTLAEGADFRTNAAGEELSIKFTTTSAQFRQTWGGVFVENMAACGIRIVPL
ncbi:MAG: ABC transporter substrate-binding protein, partial [Anaerolineales bacterium]